MIGTQAQTPEQKLAQWKNERTLINHCEKKGTPECIKVARETRVKQIIENRVIPNLKVD